MDCCDLGNEDTTYILDVSSQRYGMDWLGGISLFTFTTLNSRSVPTTTIARDGNVKAQYEAPERCTATSRKESVNAAAPKPINNLLETLCRRRPVKN